MKFNPLNNKFFGFEWKVLDQYNYKDAKKITLICFNVSTTYRK